MFKNIIKRISRKLREEEIDFVIVGGQAVLFYGEPRLTKDIDIILGVDINYLDKVLNSCMEIGLTPIPKDIDNFVKRAFVLPMIDEESKVRVDFIFSFSPFEQRTIKRAKLIKIENVSVPFVSLEDLIVFKLFAGREKDLGDVRALLKKNKDFDENYLLQTLKEISDPEHDLLKKYRDIKGKLND